MEDQKSEFIGKTRPKVGVQKLRKIVSFEEAVDASDAIRGGCHDVKDAMSKGCNGMGEEEGKIRKEQARRRKVKERGRGKECRKRVM